MALADASLSAGLLVPAVLEALWVALQDALGTEGIFRVSAAESEVAAVRQRLQEGDETERALDEASPACVAALMEQDFTFDFCRRAWPAGCAARTSAP